MAALTCEVGVTLARGRGVTPVTDEEVSPRPEYEALAHLPHPEPAIPGACDDGVSVVKGGQGRDPVGFIITGVGPVTPLYLASKQT